MSYTRFAIYYLPPAGSLASFGAAWLGWDALTGRAVDQPDLPGIAEITTAPRKYGFHGTLKPPFRLADGCDRAGLEAATAAMAARCAPGQAEGLALTRLGSFLALTPTGDASGIARVAATCVETLDAFRAPAPAVELARRRKAGLSERQEALLQLWGYPYVMAEFRFHMTLSGRLQGAALDLWRDRVAARLPPLPVPFALDAVALVGEREDGHFELIQRYALSG